MGSFVAKIYCANYGKELKGVAFCGSGDFTNYLRFVKVPFGMLVRFIGRDRQVLVKNNIVTTAWLSRSKDNRRDYLADELITKYYTPGLIETLGFLAADSSGVHWAKKVRKDLPILVLAGTQDLVGFCSYGVKMADKAMVKTGHYDIEYKWYKGFRHELLRDDCQEEVFKDLYDWTMAKM
jgi:alpha-beta hydrolase superfamily lysophospholipase